MEILFFRHSDSYNMITTQWHMRLELTPIAFLQFVVMCWPVIHIQQYKFSIKF